MKTAESGDAIQLGVLARHLDRIGVVVAAQYRALPELGHGNRKDAAAAADIDRIVRLGRIESRQHFQAAASRRMRARAEGEAGVDLERQQAGGRRIGDVRGMDPEGPDGERLEGALVLRHPIDVGQVFPAPVTFDGRFDRLPIAVAKNLDAPGSVARQLAAGDDEPALGQRLERLFAREAFGSRDVAPGLPAAHAASMKLSKTFFEPAFSNSMSSLLPSTAMMR